MSTKWVICGAGHGVGKTHLALKLADILPNAIYAKLGHSTRKPEKPSNYFRKEEELTAFVDAHASACEHLLLEANSLARRGFGDIAIYVDGIPKGNDVRSDAAELKKRANICVGPRASVRDWKGTLRKIIVSRSLCEAVCDALVEQQLYILSSPLSVKSKVWLEASGMHVFGSGLARLLDYVDRWGTLRDAAKGTGMSYRYAWDLIKNAEKHTGKKLVLPQAGGSGGGQSALSDDGRRLLDVFRRVNEEVAAFANKQFELHYHKL